MIIHHYHLIRSIVINQYLVNIQVLIIIIIINLSNIITNQSNRNMLINHLLQHNYIALKHHLNISIMIKSMILPNININLSHPKINSIINQISIRN